MTIKDGNGVYGATTNDPLLHPKGISCGGGAASIAADGTPTFANGRFLVTMSATAGTYTSGTLNKMDFNTESYDVGGRFDATNKKFIPGNGEKWIINCKLYFEGNPTTNLLKNVTIELYKNGARLRRTMLMFTDATGKLEQVAFGHQDIIVGNGTDYYEIYALATTSTGVWEVYNGGDVTYWEGIQVG